jgi:hypothetical protein
MKTEKKPVPGLRKPIHTQRHYAALTGFDLVTISNLVARRIVPVDEVVPGKGKGVRLFTRLNAWEGRIMHESVEHHKMPLADAAKIAKTASRFATEGGYVDYWARLLEKDRPLVALAFLVVTWSGNCYDAQIIGGNKAGEPDFSSSEAARFLPHPFMVIPLSALFEDVWRKGTAMLAVDQKA